MRTQKRTETHPQLNLTYATFVDIHRLHTMCHAWKASHILLKPVKCSDRRIWVQPSVGPQCKPSMCATWMRPLSVITVDPHPLRSPSPTQKVSISPVFHPFLLRFLYISLLFQQPRCCCLPRQQSPQQCGTVVLPALACFMWPRHRSTIRADFTNKRDHAP